MSTAPWENDPVDEPWLKDAQDSTPTPEQKHNVETLQVDKSNTGFFSNTVGEPILETGKKGQEEIMDLPVPTPDLYSGMELNDALALEKAYRNHPKTEKGLLSSTYKGQEIPSALDSTTGALGRGYAKGVYTAGRNVATGVSAVVERGGELAGLPTTGMTDKLDEVLPEAEFRGTAEGIGGMMGQTHTALAGGIGVANVGMKVLGQAKGLGSVAAQVAEKAPQVAKYVSNTLRIIGGAIGSGLSSEGGDPVVGPGSITSKDGFLGGTVFQDLGDAVSLDGQSDSKAQRRIEDRVNIAVGSMVIGLGVEGLAKLGSGVGRVMNNLFFKNINPLWSTSAQEKAVFKDFFDRVAAVSDAETPEQQAALLNDLITYAKDPDNQKILFNGTDIPLDTEMTMKKALAGDTSDMSQEIQKQFSQAKSDVISSGRGSSLETAAEKPSKMFAQELDKAANAKGVTPDVAADKLQRIGQQEVGAARANMTQADLDLKSKDDELLSTLEAGIKPSKSGSESFSKSQTALDDVTSEVKGGNEFIKNTQTEKYGDVGNSPFVEADGSWDELVDELIPPKEHIALGARTYNLPVPLKRVIKDAGGDYRKLVTDVKPQLSKTITGLREAAQKNPKDADYELIDLLERMQENITKKQPEFLGDVPAVQAAREADRYTKEVYGDTVAQGVPNKVEQIGSDVSIRHDKVLQEEQIRKDISGAINSPESKELGHLVKTLSRYEYNKSSPKVLTYVRAKIADKLRGEIDNIGEGIGQINPKGINDLLDKYRNVFKEFPEATKEIDTLQKSITSNRGNVQKLKELAEKYAKEASDLEDEIYSGVLKDFFERDGELKKEGITSFEDLFTGKQSTARFQKVKKLVDNSGDEDLKKGFEAAYIKTLKRSMYKPTGAADKSKMAERLMDDDSLMKIGDEIFGKDSDLMTGIRQTTAVVEGSDLRSLPRGKTMQSELSKSKSDASALTTILIGRLNRTASTIGGVTGKVLESLDPQKRAMLVRAKMLADPKEFLRMAEDFKGNPYGNNAKRKIFDFLVKANVYTNTKGDFNTFDKEWNDQEADKLNESAKSKSK